MGVAVDLWRLGWISLCKLAASRVIVTKTEHSQRHKTRYSTHGLPGADRDQREESPVTMELVLVNAHL